MPARPFHLAWFLSQGYGPKSWRSDFPGSDVSRWMMPDLFVDLAQGMERACFDYMIIEDSSNIPYTYKGSHDTYLQYAASTPKLDPAVLVPYMAAATKHLGLVPTLSVSEYPPYLLARLVNSLDHTTEGRVGWNCVTGSNDGAAQNYNRDKHRPHDERYDVADEFADIVTRLWESWEPDAVVLDRETPMFADGRKVHAINHEGKYFKVRGPLNAPRSPQGRVPICQAGGSPRGIEFASRWADTIITEGGGSAASMKAYRDRIRKRARELGRNPDDIKVLLVIHPRDISETTEYALDQFILRGGKTPNYSAASVQAACEELRRAGLPERLMIDFSHANSSKKHENQIPVCEDIGRQMAAGDNRIVGVMVESHLHEGKQDLVNGQLPKYGVSITDACISWEQTQPVLQALAEAVRQRLRTR